MQRESKPYMVAEKLREQIRSGLLVPGQRLPSERQLSIDFHVSRSAIKDAIRQLESLGLIEQEPNCRPVVVRAEPKAGTRTGRAFDQIAVWIQPDLRDYGASTILDGIRTVIAGTGRQLVIGCPPSMNAEAVQASAAQFIQSLTESSSIGGAIVWTNADPQLLPYYQRLAEVKMPLVFIDREPPAPLIGDVVSANHRRAARVVTQHLIDLGHRSIAMVINEERVSSVRDRIDGYRAALWDNHLEVRRDLIVEMRRVEHTQLREQAEAMVRRLIALPNPPTAIFAVNDQVAMYLHEAISRLGMKIPRDISLVGFDWLMRWMPSGGDLTTVAQPFDQIGQIAAERLLSRMEARAPQSFRQVLVEAPLVVRATTASPSVTARA